MKKSVIGCLLLGLLGMVPASSAADKASPTAGSALLSPAASAARSVNTFGGQLFAKLAAKEGNLAVCPFSVARALLMAAAGANGETKQEILFTLGLSAKNPEALTELAAELTAGSTEDLVNGFRLALADSLWTDESVKLKPAYPALLQKNYRAALELAPFSTDPAKAAQLINFWIEKNTAGMLRNLIPDTAFTKETRLALCDAVFFEGRWAKPFEKSATALQPFHNPKETVQVQTMRLTLNTRYESGKDYHAIALPYQRGRYSLILILPKPGATLAAAEQVWANHETWFNGWEQEVAVSLPRFSFDSTQKLAEILRALGIVEAFSPDKADFSGIAEEKLHISEVIHGGKVEIDESGTRAAAATVIGMVGTSFNPKPPVEFKVDRPFLFLIRHEETKLALFLGRVSALKDQSPPPDAKIPRLTEQGYGPWKYGMSRDEVQAVAEAGPYRPESEGGLQTLHAPWDNFNDKRADFFFDGMGQLTQIRLWICTDVSEEKARGFARKAEAFLADFGKGKEKGLADRLMQSALAGKEDRANLYSEDLSAGPGQPRARLSIMRHPQLGWYVYITFSSL